MCLHLISFVLSNADNDPVGVYCLDGEDEVDGVIILDDYQQPVDSLVINIQVSNGLNGLLPPEIGYLVDCIRIMLSNHISLTGQLPQTMGNMSNLVYAVLLLNGLGGELPSSLFQLKKLRQLRFMGVQFKPGTPTEGLRKNWTLPSNVEVDDTKLEVLTLVSSFVGTIPSWIAKLNRLQALVLTGNKCEGAIPEAIGDLSSLKVLHLGGNNITGTIPSSLGKLDAMEILFLGNNALQGALPASIGNLRKLQILDVGSNELTSTIPSSFGNLESLSKYILVIDEVFAKKYA
jgi:Leucine-rich repeat (LRR) protein